MICGIAMAVLGVFSVANDGLAFISIAFPVGIILMFAGIVEFFAYKKSNETDQENKHWILIEAFTTFAIGFIVLSVQLTADIVVLAVFGMWNMISGIRGLVVLVEATEIKKKDIDYYWILGVSFLNFAIGVYAFFNSVLLHLPVLMILGFCFALQGANVVKFGLDIPYVKPDILKTKDELIADAEEAAEQAHLDAKEAIKKARMARKKAVNAVTEVKDYEEIVNEPIVADLSLGVKEESEADTEETAETEEK